MFRGLESSQMRFLIAQMRSQLAAKAGTKISHRKSDLLLAMAISDSFDLLTAGPISEGVLTNLLREVSIPTSQDAEQQTQTLINSGIWCYTHQIPRLYVGTYSFKNWSFQVQDGLSFDVVRPKDEDLYVAYRTGVRKLLSFSSRLIALLNCDLVVLFNTGDIKLIHTSNETFLNSDGVIEEDAHLVEPPYQWFNGMQ